MRFTNHYRSCHPEPIRCAQGQLREGSVSPGTEILRCAQDDNLLRTWSVKFIIGEGRDQSGPYTVS